MKLTRQTIFNMFNDNYCPQCGIVVEMIPVATHMPGIACNKCPQCNGHYQANFLESEEDILECPDHFIIYKEEYSEIIINGTI